MPDRAALPSQALTAAEIDARAERVSTLAQELAGRSERERALPRELVEELRATGLLRAGAPASVGALEAAPAVALRSAETIARGDASAGWCVSIAITSSLLAGYLPDRGTEEIFGDQGACAAGVWAPRGRAKEVDGGLLVSGRWSFCSGISHAGWLLAGCVLESSGDASQAPVLRVVGMAKEDLEILDTWHTSGLRATASNDAVAQAVFVPEHRVASILDARPRLDTPLYRFPLFGFFALSIAAAALGNARGAIEDLKELAAQKVAQGSRRVLAERASTQAAVGEGEAAVRAARALYYEAIADAWAAAQLGGAVSEELRLGLRLAATHATRTSAEVVVAMYELGGGTAIYEDSPLQRRLRDAHTATAHFQVNAATWELAGRVLLGLATDTTQL